MNATKTQMATIEHNGFHGFHAVRFRPLSEGRHPETWEPAWVVSLRTAKRLNAVVCGASDCKCGESIAWIDDGYDSGHPCGYVSMVTEIRGNYPQGN